MESAGAKNFRELRIWDGARAIKRSLHDLVATAPFHAHKRLADQIREAASSSLSSIAEGYGRFEPGDHARFLRMGKASLVECQNHLIDATDRGLISEAVRDEYDGAIQKVLKGIGALIAYLQSAEAKKNAERIKRRSAHRGGKRSENFEH
jgi:four helix bundle protein